MGKKLRKFLTEFRLSMRMKAVLALGAIAVTLLVSSLLSVMEYTRMSDYVSELIGENIRSINVAQRLASVSNEYNLEILTIIGDTTRTTLPPFDEDEFMRHCDDLRTSLATRNLSNLADSVEYSFSAYMLTSLELPSVLESDFIDTRTWYFDRLQPVYGRLRGDIERLSESTYQDLQKNSATFERGFYRSVIPGAVSVAVGLMLVLMLLFFVLSYFVNPVYKMNEAFDEYRLLNKKYSYDFDGDDELSDLNRNITELADENAQLRKRLRALRDTMNQK